MGKEQKMKKLDEITMKNFQKDFNELSGKEKRAVKKELKKILKDNYMKNKDRGTLYGK